MNVMLMNGIVISEWQAVGIGGDATMQQLRIRRAAEQHRECAYASLLLVCQSQWFFVEITRQMLALRGHLELYNILGMDAGALHHFLVG